MNTLNTQLQLIARFGLLLLLVLFITTSSAAALTPKSIETIRNGTWRYEQEVVKCGVVVSNGETATALSGADNPEKVWNYFVSKGLTDEQTAGVMGNIQAESGFDPGIEEYGNSIGYGIAQWSFGRREALEAAAIAKGVPVNDLAFQLDFLYQELNARGISLNEYKNLGSSEWEGLTKQTTIEDALVFFHHEFEVSHLMNFQDPRQAVIDARGAFAQQWFDKFGGSGAGGCGVLSGLTSPVQMQGIGITDGFGPRTSPCAGCSTWHVGTDYINIANLGVYAIMDGEVIDANKSGGNNIVKIRHADGLISSYWHMYASDILVNTGDQVTSGQQIGTIGCSGQCTGAHLHFELDISQVDDPSVYAQYPTNTAGNAPPGTRIDSAVYFTTNISGFSAQ